MKRRGIQYIFLNSLYICILISPYRSIVSRSLQGEKRQPKNQNPMKRWFLTEIRKDQNSNFDWLRNLIALRISKIFRLYLACKSVQLAVCSLKSSLLIHWNRILLIYIMLLFSYCSLGTLTSKRFERAFGPLFAASSTTTVQGSSIALFGKSAEWGGCSRRGALLSMTGVFCSVVRSLLLFFLFLLPLTKNNQQFTIARPDE